MILFISIIGLFIVAGVLLIIMHKDLQNVGVAKNESEKIIKHFEPDNVAPELSEMINYHKENGVVRYEI